LKTKAHNVVKYLEDNYECDQTWRFTYWNKPLQ